MMSSDSGQKKKPAPGKQADTILGMDPSVLLSEEDSSVDEKPTQWPGPKKSEKDKFKTIPKEDRWEGALAPSLSEEQKAFASMEGVEAKKEEVWSGALQSREDYTNINTAMMPFDPKDFIKDKKETKRQDKPEPPAVTREFVDLLGQGCERDDLMMGNEETFCVPIEDEEPPEPEIEEVVEVAAPTIEKAPVMEMEQERRKAKPLATRLWFQVFTGMLFFGAGAVFAHFVLPRLFALLP